MTLGEHLTEIRHRFLIVALSLGVLGVLSFIFYPEILHFLQRPYCHASPKRCTFLVTNPLDGLSLRVKIAFYGGMFFSLPVVLWQSWRFITPGTQGPRAQIRGPLRRGVDHLLRRRGGRGLLQLRPRHPVPPSRGGQVAGLVLQPRAIPQSDSAHDVRLRDHLRVPGGLVALELARVVTPRQLLRAWRYALIAITITSAVITPSGDPLSMMALAIPLTIFYFAAIAVGKLCKR